MSRRTVWFYSSLTLFVALASILYLRVMLSDLDAIIELYGSEELSTMLA